MKTIKTLFKIITALIVVAVAVIVACQVAVNHAAQGCLYSDVNKLPPREVGLLLGTSPIGRSGKPNQFFLRRIDAAVELYEAGKIDRFIISGAKRDSLYDEPKEMKAALLSRGLPDTIITLDGEGYRTIASITRAKEVFGVDSLTIISQQFHCERALFLARHKSLNAIAYSAETTSSQKWRLLMWLRESLARVKAAFEVLCDRTLLHIPMDTAL